jgi:hypothetical protein
MLFILQPVRKSFSSQYTLLLTSSTKEQQIYNRIHYTVRATIVTLLSSCTVVFKQRRSVFSVWCEPMFYIIICNLIVKVPGVA